MGIWVFFVLFLQVFSKFETISKKSLKENIPITPPPTTQPSEFKMTYGSISNFIILFLLISPKCGEKIYRVRCLP